MTDGISVITYSLDLAPKVFFCFTRQTIDENVFKAALCTLASDYRLLYDVPSTLVELAATFPIAVNAQLDVYTGEIGEWMLKHPLSTDGRLKFAVSRLSFSSYCNDRYINLRLPSDKLITVKDTRNGPSFWIGSLAEAITEARTVVGHLEIVASPGKKLPAKVCRVPKLVNGEPDTTGPFLLVDIVKPDTQFPFPVLWHVYREVVYHLDSFDHTENFGQTENVVRGDSGGFGAFAYFDRPERVLSVRARAHVHKIGDPSTVLARYTGLLLL